MPRIPSTQRLSVVITSGAAIGALSWLVASLVSGKFEPFDSGQGLLFNQFILVASTTLLAWQSRPLTTLLFLGAAYVGMNAYAYALGGSEHRAWALLGAVINALLIVAPAALAIGTTLLRRLVQRRSAPEVQRVTDTLR